MRISDGLLTVMCIGALSQAMAVEPPSSPAPQARPESATSAQTDRTPADPQPGVKAPVAAQATAPTTATASSSGTQVKLTTTDPEAQAELSRLRTAGYKPEVHNGEILFCRKEIVLGSHFEKKICGSAAQLAQTAREAQQNAEKAQRNSRNMIGN